MTTIHQPIDTLADTTTDAATDAVLPAMPSPEAARAAAERLGSVDAVLATVLDIAGARPLALDAFLRVSRVEWSEEVATACIECADRPRLLLNAAFVEARCHTPERLATLLLHELAHVSMGHTRLFPRPTFAHNLACDAIINREIAALAFQSHGDVPRLTALFVECYPAHEAPWFLLRPPPGWPLAPDWDASRDAPPALRELHRRLYDCVIADDRHDVQYSEIVDALRGPAAACLTDAAAQGGDAALLGAHGATAAEVAACSGARDAIGADVFADAMERLTGRLAGAGGHLEVTRIGRSARDRALERALHQLLVRCFQLDGHRTRPAWTQRPARTVLSHHDRRAAARVALARAFGAPRPLLFDDHVAERRLEPKGATIYVDVSWSMDALLPRLHAVLVPLRHRLRPHILLFSTTIVEPDQADFDAGRLASTGGTSIDPVVAHLLRREGPRPTALVLTDGYFAAPSGPLQRALRDRGAQLHLGVAGPGPLHDQEPWVTSSRRLPSC